MPGARQDSDAATTPPLRPDDGSSQRAPRGSGRGRRGAGSGRATRGQALVELALIVPILVLMLAIAADFGRAFTAYITVSSAAREGAAYGMLSESNAIDTAGIASAALADAPAIWGVAPTVASLSGTDADGYTFVRVTVSYTFTPLVSFPPIPNSIGMTRTVEMRVIN